MVFSSTDMFGTYGTTTFTRQRGIFKINFSSKIRYILPHEIEITDKTKCQNMVQVRNSTNLIHIKETEKKH